MCRQHQGSAFHCFRLYLFLQHLDCFRRREGEIIQGVICNDHFVDFAKEILCQTLAEFYKKRWYKGRFCLVSWQPDAIPEIRILRDFLNWLSFRETKLFLNQQRAECHPERFCWHSGFTGKKSGILFFQWHPTELFQLS